MRHRACDENRELISAFLDGQLSPDERAQLHAHLATCVECRATLDAYRGIGAAMRSMPAAHPPTQLTDAIYAQTVDAGPRRLFLLSSRVGYSVAAVAAVLLVFVVAGYLLVGGYQRGIEPAVAASAPVNNQAREWPLHQPVTITFNKAMNQASVDAALGIQPPGEAERLIREWDGNTLIIGANQLLKPDSTYLITITADARDKWGNPMGSAFTLNFTTTRTVATMPTPASVADLATPEPNATSAATARSNETGAPSLDAPATGGGNPTPPPTNTPLAQTAPNTPLSATSTPSVGVTAHLDPTATPWSAATATVASDPSDGLPIDLDPQPSATSAATTPTPVVDPPTPPPPTEAPAPPATATPDYVIAVTGAFGDVYWGQQTVQDRLGAPTASAFVTDGQILGFQHGSMLHRADNGTIYVLPTATLGLWNSFSDMGEPYPTFEEVEPGVIWTPGGVFGQLWQTDSSISDSLGFAISGEATGFEASVQRFERGFMLETPESVYVFYEDDLTVEYFPNS